MACSPDPQQLESYARAAAGAAGIEIDEAWWPGVIGHLGVVLSRAASLAKADLALPEDPAPSFQP